MILNALFPSGFNSPQFTAIGIDETQKQLLLDSGCCNFDIINSFLNISGVI